VIARSESIVSGVIKSALALLAALAPVPQALAHEVPTDVVIQAIVKPENDTLNLLVRVPLEAMRDVNFPQTGPGYLVISAADETVVYSRCL